MPKPDLTLGAVLLESVVDGLTPLVAMGFMYDAASEEKMKVLREDVRGHVVPTERLRVFSDSKENPVAFIASKQVDTEHGVLYHLEGIILHPDYQSKGLGVRLLEEEFRDTNAELLGFHTQNLQMFKLGDKLSEHSFTLSHTLSPLMGTPNPLPALSGERHIKVHSSRYGSNLYDNLDRFMSEGRAIPGLDIEAGDAMVFVGKIRKGGA